MERIALVLFIVVVAGSTTFVVITGQELPLLIASHFGMQGTADSYIARSSYLALFTFLVAGVPVLIAGLAAILVRNASEIGHGRATKFWNDPYNRDIAVEYVTSRTLVLCAVLSVFMAAVHHMVVRAHRVRPPSLPYPDFSLLVAGFILLFIVLAVAFGVGFNRIASDGRFNG